MGVTELDQRTIADTLDYLRYGARENHYIRTYARGAVPYNLNAREIYSYGQHFPLVRYVPAKLRGRGADGRRRPDLYVINGDRWRGSRSRTGAHQSYVRERLELYDAERLIVPFSALTGADIDIDSIRPVHVRADQQWTETRTARDIAEVPQHARRESYSETLSAPTLEMVPSGKRELYRELTPAERAEHGREYGYAPILPGPDGLYRWEVARSRPIKPDSDGLYRWDVHLHRLGDALFSAVRAEPQPDGTVWRRRALYLSSFDTNENPPLYFLAEVPRATRPDTVETALDALAPRAVHAAIARDIEVRRQGDIFFVDTSLTREQLAARGARFARLTLWTRDAVSRQGEIGATPKRTAEQRRRRAVREHNQARRTFSATIRAQLARDARPETGKSGRRRARQERERAARELELSRAALRRLTLAGPSRQQSRYGSTFANELIRARERLETIARRVRANELTRAMGARDEYRRRERHAVEVWRLSLESAQRTHRPETVFDSDRWRERRELTRRSCAIYGTAHSATELAHVNGAVYARGTVRHVPNLEPNRNGEPDHRPLVLTPERWYLAVRNTVPRQARRRRRAQ